MEEPFDASNMSDDEFAEMLEKFSEIWEDELEGIMRDQFGDDVFFDAGKPLTEAEGSTVATYTVEFTFGAQLAREDVEQWVEAVVQQLPEGTESKVKQHPMLVDVENLTDAHKGATVKVHVEGRDVEGTLEGVHMAGGTSGNARVLVIDGKAWTVNYGVVQVNIWN